MRKLLLLAVLASAAQGADPVQFNRDIRPIFSDKCFPCHGPDAANRSTALRFDSRESVLAELPSGVRAVVPGDADASELIRRIASEDPVRRMPPAYQGHAKLSDREIDLMRRWVEQGAEWQGHWAFIPPQRPAVPKTAHDDWALNPLDHFVARRLEREGLKPAPEADKSTLIRRATLDLTGLPPTPAEVDAFLADRSANAYEKVIDRLLDSPRYGERMAFRWLDAARYADTNGYQNDEERDMWRWRDWVIEAFNRNQPFDQFTIEQLAGDLLPNATLDQLIASGFNRNHRGNGEGGVVFEEYHVEYVVDRVEATSTVWMGVTMGCARCHDHKYDPFTQKEFYEFYAYFNNVPDRGRYFKYGNTPPIVPAPTPGQQAELATLEERIDGLEAKLRQTADASAAAQRQWEQKIRNSAIDWSFDEKLLVSVGFDDGKAEGPRPALGAAAALTGEDFVDLGDKADFNFYQRMTLAAWIRPEKATGGIVTRMEPKSTSRGDKGYGLFLVDGKLQFRIESTDIDDRMRIETVDLVPLGRWSHVAVTYDGSRLTRGMRLYVDGKQQELHVILDHSNNDTNAPKTPLRVGHGPDPDDRFQGAIDDVRVYERDLSEHEVAVVATAESLAEIAAVPEADRTRAQADKLHWAFLSSHAPEPTRTAWNGLRALRLERQAMIDGFPTVMVMDELTPPRQAHLLKRGSFDAPGEPVNPGIPASLGSLPEGDPNSRLTLARWLVSRDNPLTARVTVNRFWQMMFGVGIVKTVEDFGSQGEWPTHPELLDWLAVEFIESGWDVKGILKTMLMSATYRQESTVTPELLERDPENRLLARGSRLRLPAESIRDQALAVAGLLEERLGGPSVKPYQPAGLWTELSNWAEYEHDRDEGLYRRSLYTFWKRTIAPPAMVTFDSAARETCVVRETRTNTPLQALDLMNDVTYVEAARRMAERMIREGGATPDERLDFGFRLATARAPEAMEREILLASFRRFIDRYQTSPQDAESFLSAGESPRPDDLDATEHAAYTAVASLILNLDEAITKE